MNLLPGFRIGLTMSVFAISTGLLLAADTLIIDENFDVKDFASSDTPAGYEAADLGVTATRAYKDGAGAGASRAMVLSATFAGSTAQSLAAIQYQNGAVTGNDSSNPADYFLQFDAKGSKASRQFQLLIQGWSQPHFQGEQTGHLLTTLVLPDSANTFHTYRIALNDPSLTGTFDPSSKTYQITFQIFGTNWGDGPDNVLTIDHIQLGRIAKP